MKYITTFDSNMPTLTSIREHLDIKQILNLYPQWLLMNWIPIAGDGSTNLFVVDVAKNENKRHPVYYVDTQESPDKPTYIAASGALNSFNFLRKGAR